MSKVVQIEFATGTKLVLQFKPEGFRPLEGYWFGEEDTWATIHKSPLITNLVLSAFPDPPETNITNLVSNVQAKYPDAAYILVLLQKIEDSTYGAVMVVDSLPISGTFSEEPTLPLYVDYALFMQTALYPVTEG